MTYTAEYDRLLQEARAVAAQEADAARALQSAPQTPRERAAHASGLLALRTRLLAVLAGISRGQAGQGSSFTAAPSAAASPFPALADSIASLELRLSAVHIPPAP